MDKEFSDVIDMAQLEDELYESEDVHVFCVVEYM